MKAITAAALVYCLSIDPAFSYSYLYDGNQLWEECDGDLSGQWGLCSGYTAAVIDSHQALMSKGKYLFCAPSDATLRQFRDVVKKHLRDHPQDRHHPAASLVIQALREAFPCKD